jgi:hypothetical protein
MSKITKGGRTPIAAKIENSDFSHDEFDYSIMRLDPEIIAHLEEKGLSFRWINATKYKNDGGFHKSGWRAYRLPDDVGSGSLDFSFGRSPEGYLIRNDLMLAVKPKELQERWKKHLASKVAAQDVSGKSRADELREMSRKAGVKTTVTEGYDEN